MNPITRTGAEILRPAMTQAGYGIWLAGRTLLTLHHLWKRARQLLDYMYIAGVKTMPVVLFVGFFIGMIVALQVGLELARFGQQESIGLLVAVTMAREMSPFVTCIILAASVASAMAAELGTMKVQEEITALEILSIDVVSFLVVPRVVALTLLAPLLTLLADVVGILGGGVIAVTQLGLDFQGYLDNTRNALSDLGELVPVPWDLYAGLFKALVFGFIISVVGCANGLQAKNGARGVGETTRSAVRNSILLIIIFNFFLGKLLHH
ncbi:MAG: ABC transporter permease [Planctomycetota bacterium]|nr:MAG: ABC transporter permease [Planctomycetota bacterium]